MRRCCSAGCCFAIFGLATFWTIFDHDFSVDVLILNEINPIYPLRVYVIFFIPAQGTGAMASRRDLGAGNRDVGLAAHIDSVHRKAEIICKVARDQ